MSICVKSYRGGGELRAGWGVTDTLAVPADWRSGYYLAKLALTSGDEVGRSAGVPFVVRAHAGARTPVLVVAPVSTWQAYNDWGGRSLYSDPKPAVKVFFDRPYASSDDQLQLDYPAVPLHRPARLRHGVHDGRRRRRRPRAARRPPARRRPRPQRVLDEGDARRLRGRARARGQPRLPSGNTAYRPIRYADAERRVREEYRSSAADPSPNPRQKTVRWREAPLNRPECSLVGVQWQGGDDSRDPGPHHYAVVARDLSDPWFRGTGFEAGDTVRGAVGRDWDAVAPECADDLPGLTVLFHYEGKRTPQPDGVYTSTFHSTSADFVRYRTPSGATVLAVGSMELGWVLASSADGSPAADGLTDPSHPPAPRLQRLLRNAFDELSR